MPGHAVSHQRFVELHASNTHARQQAAVLILAPAVDGHLLAMNQVGRELLRAGGIGLPVFGTVDALEPNANRLSRRPDGNGVAVVDRDDGRRELPRYCWCRLRMSMSWDQQRCEDEDLR